MGFMPKRGLDVSKCEIARSAAFALLSCMSVPTCHRRRHRGFSHSVIFGKEWGYFAGGGGWIGGREGQPVLFPRQPQR